MFFNFWEQRGAIGVEMLLQMQERRTSIDLNASDTLHSLSLHYKQVKVAAK